MQQIIILRLNMKRKSRLCSQQTGSAVLESRWHVLGGSANLV